MAKASFDKGLAFFSRLEFCVLTEVTVFHCNLDARWKFDVQFVHQARDFFLNLSLNFVKHWSLSSVIERRI
jgi:hypothetical protein